MSEQVIKLIVEVREASIPEWFVEFVHEGRVKRLGAKLGETITVPAGAFVSRYGPVEPPETTLNLGHSIKVLPDVPEGR